MAGKYRGGALASLDAQETGTGVNVSDLEDVYVHISGTFVGTIKTEISFDQGTTWAEFDSDTAPALVGPLPPCSHVRGRCSAYTSGTAVLNYGGRDPNRR